MLTGTFVGERRETGELFALSVKENVVRRRTLVPPREGVDEWGYGDDDEERMEREGYLIARRQRFAAAIEQDRLRAG